MQENAETLNNQAILLAKNGKTEEAVVCFKRAIILERTNSTYYYNLGITYRDQGFYDKAKDLLIQAHNINEEDETITEALAQLCFTMKDFDDCLSYCYEGLDLNCMNSHLWNTVGAVNFNKEEYEDAQEAFELAVELNPYYYDALYNLKDTYEMLNNDIGYAECVKKLQELKR